MNTVLEQANYYDQRWSMEGFANGLQAARCAAVLRALHHIEIKQPRILDMGCGTGWLAGILGQFGPTTGVDLSDFAVKVASTKFPWVKFCSGDIFEWSRTQSAGSFNVVVSQEVIEHVEDQAGYLDIAARLLGDEGYLILTTPNDTVVRRMRNASAWSNQPVENTLSIGQLRSLVSRNFEIIQIGTIVPGFGDLGACRLLNSNKLLGLLDSIKLKRVYFKLLLRCSMGLHTVVLARKL
jgi:2-polyprenyl-3-methyl-5-hydroxy-6-metoxy-1,4-benzoquinol methylase